MGGRGTGGAMHVGGGGRMASAPRHSSFGAFPQNHFGGTFHSGGFHSCPNCSHFHTHNAFYPRWRFAYGYPYYGYGYGYGLGYSYYPPAWDWDYSYSQSDDRSYESERALTSQIDELNQEMQRLREQQAERAYQPEPPRPAPITESPQPKPTESRRDVSTILVFRDQHIQEVQNYAIVGKDLVVVADRRSTKIPLERLDLAATAKLNDERGVDFQLPR